MTTTSQPAADGLTTSVIETETAKVESTAPQADAASLTAYRSKKNRKKEGFESTVKLTSFAIYRTHHRKGSDQPDVEVLHGAVDSRFNPATGKIELLADSVPFNLDRFKPFAPKPGYGMLMLYGIRDSMEELQKWRTRARELKAEFVSTEFEFEVGDIEKGLTSFELMEKMGEKSRFVNLRRLVAGVQDGIYEQFKQYAIEDGSFDPEASRVVQISTRPDFFDRLFEEYKPLRFLDVMVIPVADIEFGGKEHLRQVAYVRPGTRLVGMKEFREDVTILLPAWLTDEKVAKKQRKIAATA